MSSSRAPLQAISSSASSGGGATGTGTNPSSKEGGAGISVVLKKLLNKNPDLKAVYIHTYDGVELISEVKSRNEDVVSNSSTIGNFSSSVDQASRLKLGSCNYTLSWCNNGIVLHAPVESLVMSMHFDESANIGKQNDFISTLCSPIFLFLDSCIYMFICINVCV